MRLFIKAVVRTRFLFTSARQAAVQIRKAQRQYLELAESIASEDGERGVRVPPMLGVDEDMRDWSFYMILGHNVIVNRGITSLMQSLCRGEEPSGAGAIDMKHEVMPSAQAGAEQVEAFRTSVEEHLEVASKLTGLRGTATRRHPFFGELNAHGWHCMFGAHLNIHLKQAETLLRIIKADRGN